GVLTPYPLLERCPHFRGVLTPYKRCQLDFPTSLYGGVPEFATSQGCKMPRKLGENASCTHAHILHIRMRTCAQAAKMAAPPKKRLRLLENHICKPFSSRVCIDNELSSTALQQAARKWGLAASRTTRRVLSTRYCGINRPSCLPRTVTPVGEPPLWWGRGQRARQWVCLSSTLRLRITQSESETRGARRRKPRYEKLTPAQSNLSSHGGCGREK
ncbi:hypothetical protein GBAR_LOCUS931, partial [Geodia barretti]